MQSRPITAVFALLVLLAMLGDWSFGQRSDKSPSIRKEVSIPLPQVPYVQDSLQRLFQGHVRIAPSRSNSYEIELSTGIVLVEFPRAETMVKVEGPGPLANDMANLISALGKRQPNDSIRILPLNDNGQASLKQSSMLPGMGSAKSDTVGNLGLPSFMGLRKTELASTQQNAISPQALPSSMPNALQSKNQGLTPQQTNPQIKPPLTGTLPLPQFEGVQIEMLPEIDAIILRGRDQQLNDLSEIIKQLDEASRLSRAEIEVLPLMHASSESLAKLIIKIQESLVSTRQGRVSITPLGKPNALLLIGWGDAIASAKEMIAKLDVPAQADAQYTVVQLKHAIANEIQTQLQSFFKTREGLGPLIQTTVDTRSNALIIYAAPRDLEEVRSLIDRLDVPRGALLQQARVFPMRYSLAADVAQSLKQALTSSTTGPGTSVQLLDKDGQAVATSGILGTSQITVNERNNSIVISSSPDNLQLIEKLIEQLDTPGMVAKIKIFPVKNGDAAALVDTLRSLLPTAGPGTQSATQLSNAPDETSLLPLRFTVDSRGNNIIVVGSDGDLKIVEALILRLDESDKLQRKSIVYQLKNSPAVDVALTVNEFLRNKRQVEVAAPGANNPFEQLEREVVVVPEPVQNKLILSATPRYYDEIRELIEQLDQQPPQVMIQVMIAEISLGNTDEFGVEFGLQDSVLFDRSLLGGLLTRTNTVQSGSPSGIITSTSQEIVAASNTPGFNFNSKDPLGNSGSSRALDSSGRVGSQGISNFSVGRSNNDLGFGGLVLSASSENVSFLLRALQDTRRLEILSRPQVLTLDNQQAFIQVGQKVPRIISSNIAQNGFVQNNIALENVGLIIGVTPRISSEGHVVMEIDAEKSKLGPENEGIPLSIGNTGNIIRSPRIDTINAQATVSAADGETIILGGLISRSVKTEHRQVPWLGSLPILKYLFSYDLSEMQKTELLIIMTPHVVRSQGDMERLKQAEFARMSWCEADVFEIHGDVYPTTDLSADMMKRDDWNVVYPDVDPRGGPEPTPNSSSINRTPPIGSPVYVDPTNLPAGYSVPPTSTQPVTTASSIQPQVGANVTPTVPRSMR